jgi:peptide deformylase
LQRHRDLVVRAQDERGQVISITLGGEDRDAMWVARIFQHEYDHLQVGVFEDWDSRGVLIV